MKTLSGAYDTVPTSKPETTAALHELLRRVEAEYRETVTESFSLADR